jgi:two-component system NtrC family response regulator
MENKPSLLIIDDHEHILKQLTWALSDEFEIHAAVSKEEALDLLREKRPMLMTVDLALTRGQERRQEGFDVLQAALQQDPLIRAVVITSDQEQATAVRALKTGACDFFVKPLPLEDLRAALKRAAYLAQLDRQATPAAGAADDTGITGESPAVVALRDLVRRVAETDFTALVLGESGAGKEVVARALWKLSGRRARPFVVVNCAAIPEPLLESELFGHERGSFTGAHALKKGKVEAAECGTLFLDEIGDLSLGLQAKLLRFLQERTIERVGGAKPIQLDVRIIAATNRDLAAAVQARLFREDLYYRLKVLPIQVPPLRDRGDDVLLLAQHFLGRVARELNAPPKQLAHDAELMLMRHAWPGNVRELENVIRAAAVRCPQRLIAARYFELEMAADLPCDLRATRDQVERALIERALSRNGGVISRAARDLSVSRVTLYDLLEKHGLRPGDGRPRE